MQIKDGLIEKRRFIKIQARATRVRSFPVSGFARIVLPVPEGAGMRAVWPLFRMGCGLSEIICQSDSQYFFELHFGASLHAVVVERLHVVVILQRGVDGG